jgi:hypothetical protein
MGTEPSSARHLLVINGEQDDVYSQWYRTVHIPDIVSTVPGFVAGQLFQLSPVQLSADRPLRQFMAVFEIEGDPATAVAELRKARKEGRLQPSPPNSSTPGATAVFEPVMSKYSVLRAD